MRAQTIVLTFFLVLLLLFLGAALISNAAAVSAAQQMPSNWLPAGIDDVSRADNNPELLGQSETLTVSESITIYLPMVYNRWPQIPFTPEMNPIDNADGDGNYTVSWTTASFANIYTLEEDDNPAFSSPTTRYSGSGTFWVAANQTLGTYYYRVRAHNSWGASGWSNIRFVPVTLIFFDDFHNAGSGWAIVENDISRWRYLGGSYEGTIKIPGKLSRSKAPIQVQTDYYSLQAYSYTYCGPEVGYHGLVFGMSDDEEEYYLFLVTHFGVGAYQLVKHTSSGLTQLREWTTHVMSAECRSTLKVERKGERIDLFVDGVHVDTVFDGELNGTRNVGVVVGAFSDVLGTIVAYFDDFEVRAIGNGLLASPPLATPVRESNN